MTLVTLINLLEMNEEESNLEYWGCKDGKKFSKNWKKMKISAQPCAQTLSLANFFFFVKLA